RPTQPRNPVWSRPTGEWSHTDPHHVARPAWGSSSRHPYAQAWLPHRPASRESRKSMNTGNAAPKKRDPRTGLRMSTSLATVFTILGHTVFGFEQPVSQIFIALAVGYSCALLFEWVDARANHVEPGYAGGGFPKLVDFLLPAHMTSITLSFLL